MEPELEPEEPWEGTVAVVPPEPATGGAVAVSADVVRMERAATPPPAAPTMRAITRATASPTREPDEVQVERGAGRGLGLPVADGRGERRRAHRRAGGLGLPHGCDGGGRLPHRGGRRLRRALRRGGGRGAGYRGVAGHSGWVGHSEARGPAGWLSWSNGDGMRRILCTGETVGASRWDVASGATQATGRESGAKPRGCPSERRLTASGAAGWQPGGVVGAVRGDGRGRSHAGMAGGRPTESRQRRSSSVTSRCPSPVRAWSPSTSTPPRWPCPTCSCAGACTRSPRRILPFTPGQEVVGPGAAVGPGVDLEVGARVMGVTGFFLGQGGFADVALAPAGSVHPAPEWLDDERAAGFVIAFQTAWIGLVLRGRLVAGDTLVVLGAAGGTGAAAVLLGKALGATVVAVVAGAEKVDRVRALGADVVIDRTAGSVPDAVQGARPTAGAPTSSTTRWAAAAAEESVGYLANEGRLLLVGFASGRWPDLPAHDLVRANASAVGVFAGAYTRAESVAMIAELLDLAHSGRLAGVPDHGRRLRRPAVGPRRARRRPGRRSFGPPRQLRLDPTASTTPAGAGGASGAQGEGVDDGGLVGADGRAVGGDERAPACRSPST